MEVSAFGSIAGDTASAFAEVAVAVEQNLSGTPDFVLAYFSETHEAATVLSLLTERYPQAKILGGSSCQGVMASGRVYAEGGSGLGVLAIRDADGAYGIGAHPMNGNPRQAAQAAIRQAVQDAGRVGEIPELIWLASAPGHEERILDGIRDVVGSAVPVAGGSTGDNSVSGNWHQIAGREVFSNGVVLAALFPSAEVSYAFHNGYTPTGVSGTVTRTNGREVMEINGRPSAEVYNEWTDGLISDAMADGGNVLAQTTLHPLGRWVEEIEGVPCYVLSHPDSVTADGTIRFFSEVHEGEEVILMTGSRDSLISRAGRVVSAAAAEGGAVLGGFCTYCAGCMLAVGQEMDKVASSVSLAMNNRPFLGAFTFGEQGCTVGQENRHGNLMVSVVLFHEQGQPDA